MAEKETFADFIRDAPFGQLVRLLTRNRVFQYPEERPDFKLPDQYTKLLQASEKGQLQLDRTRGSRATSDSDRTSEKAIDNDDLRAQENGAVDVNANAESEEKSTTEPTQLDDGTILVEWYGASDPENPQNWPRGRKNAAAAIIVIYTLAIYVGSSICTPAYGGIQARFGVSLQVVALTLSMYVLAYGLGPLIWSPLSEVPSIGRSPPYIITFALYVILIVPNAVGDNFAGIVVLRFLTGFLGGPALATGPASLGDLYSFADLPYALSLWAFAATSGPAIAPLISGFSVAAEGWRWAYWEMLWLSGPIWIAMFVFLPETSASNLLLRRAQRLRKLTGLTQLKSQSEIDQANMKFRAVVIESLWRPTQMMLLDPSVAFTALYSALIYGIFYSFFESFPLVYGEMHGFNLGEQGLVFVSINIGAGIAIICYWTYIYRVFAPSVRNGTMGPPERRLIPALYATFLIPIGLFIFAWTSDPDIHWIAPTIGVSVVLTGIFIVLQCIFLYLPLSYPQYTASLFAGNDLARSVLAAAAIHFSIPLYKGLDVPRGVTLLAGLTVGCSGGVYALWHFGARLRARSRFSPK